MQTYQLVCWWSPQGSGSMGDMLNLGCWQWVSMEYHPYDFLESHICVEAYCNVEYSNKLVDLIGNGGYCKVKKDSTLKTERKLSQILGKNKDLIPQTKYRQLIQHYSKLPHIYGLPKIHKDGIPLRSMISWSQRWQPCSSHFSTGASLQRQGRGFCFSSLLGWIVQFYIFIVMQTLHSAFRRWAIGVFLWCGHTVAQAQFLHVAWYPIHPLGRTVDW